MSLADNNGIALRVGENDTGEILDNLAWGNTANGFDLGSEQNPGTNQSLIRTNLFDGPAQYTLAASSARNSNIELLPDVIDDPPADDPPDPDDTQDNDNENNDDDAQDEEIEPFQITITELLPNPAGSDSGLEKIELYNAGTNSVDLTGFKLDDIAGADPLSSNAYTLEDLEIASENYLSLVIPIGKFSLNNTGGDVVTLFDNTGRALDTVFYEGTVPENQSYSKFGSNWAWSNSTFGTDNGNPPAVDSDDNEDEDKDKEVDDKEDLGDYDNSGLEITELLPNPETGAAEFIEIHNSGEEAAQLSQVELWIGDRHKTLPKFKLEIGDYYVIEQTFLPVQLRNSGQTIKLMEAELELDNVTYPTAGSGYSFAKFEDGFLWTITITKAADNILELPEEIKKEAATIATKTTAKKAAPTTAAVAKKSTTSTAKPLTSTTPLPTTSPEMQLASDPVDQNTQPLSSANKTSDSLGKIIAMGAAAVAAGVIALYKLVFTAGVE
jgi:hypothetical protein